MTERINEEGGGEGDTHSAVWGSDNSFIRAIGDSEADSVHKINTVLYRSDLPEEYASIIYKVDFPPESNSQSKYKTKIEHLNLVILCPLPKLNKLLLAAISGRGPQRLCLTVNY